MEFSLIVVNTKIQGNFKHDNILYVISKETYKPKQWWKVKVS